jgi:hypothetical protein
MVYVRFVLVVSSTQCYFAEQWDCTYKASLVHYSFKLPCGLANFGIAHTPSLLENTADRRRDRRRREYGDESDPDVRVPRAHLATEQRGEDHRATRSRTRLARARERGSAHVGYREQEGLMVCELKGHGKSPAEKKRIANIGGGFQGSSGSS